MAKKNETEETKVLTTKDDEINDVGKEVQSISKDDVGDLKDIIPDDSDESGIDKLSNAKVVVPDDEEDFTYENPPPVAEKSEEIPSWKEVKSALRRLAALSLSNVEFKILEQSFPKIFGEE